MNRDSFYRIVEWNIIPCGGTKEVFNKKKILNYEINKHSSETISNEKKAVLRKTLLEMVEEIDSICRKHDIKLFLVGGSLLGAIRHKGFIPWDDDVDFGMSRKDYKKFISIFEQEFSDKFYMRCPNTPYPNGNRFMQIYKKNTVLETIEGSNPLQPKCLAIDIFPYDYAPNNYMVRQIKGLVCNALMFIASSVTNRAFPNEQYEDILSKSVSGKLFYLLEKLTGFLFSWRNPTKWFDTVDKAIQQKINLCI